MKKRGSEHDWLIGVTGHLKLSQKEREVVNRQAREALEDFFKGPDKPQSVRVLSGLAPGADLILTNAVFEVAAQFGIRVSLTALIVDSPEELIRQWVRHAASRGSPVRAETQELMRQMMQALVDRADQQFRIVPCGDDVNHGFKQLAAIIANYSDTLIAALRADAPYTEGGARQVVAWWQKPMEIPSELLIGTYKRVERQRHLIDIDPQSGRESQTSEVLVEVSDVRAALRAGNALGASDLAHRALSKYPRHFELRYLLLQSLAASGRSTEALRRYEDLSPPFMQSNEDWLALRGRLHKDLAFAGRDAETNIQQAAYFYAKAHEFSGGYFSAINAATTHLIAGRSDEAEEFATRVLFYTQHASQQDDVSKYYCLASRAEAFAVLGQWQDCAQQLKLVDPLLRDELATRARTRQQIARVIEFKRGPKSILNDMRMPFVFVLQDRIENPPPLPSELANLVDGAPVFDVIGADGPGQLKTLQMLEASGAHLTRLKVQSGVSVGALTVAEEPGVDHWQRKKQQRYACGLAELNAALLEVDVRALTVVSDESSAPQWQLKAYQAKQGPAPAASRRMVGLVFSDLVGFSRYDDVAVDHYWSKVVPRLAEAIAEFDQDILLKRTWGDAIHLVTQDVVSAALATQALLAAVRDLRAEFPKHAPRLAMRVGAHFASVGIGFDAISDCATFYGSELSLTARVEPVTPPGTVYVTEEFACELKLVAPEQFDLVYAGQVPLAKNYGDHRLYALHPVLAKH